MVGWPRHSRLPAVLGRTTAAVIVFGAFLTSAIPDLTAQQQVPSVTGTAATDEVRAIAEKQRQMLREVEPQLARLYGKGSPEYVAALQAHLEALTKAAGTKELSPDDPRAFQRKAPPRDSEAPFVFPINEDPRAAKALELQRQQIIREVTAVMPRVHGGRPTLDPSGRDRFPHTVALKSANGGARSLCSGVLVAARAVLTAQHCVCDLKLDAKSEVHIGLNVGQGQVYRVTQVVSFARVACPTRAFGDDLALVFFNAASAPAPLAPIGLIQRIEVGTPLWVAGFGEQEDLDIGQKLTAQIGVVSPICGHPTDPARYGCVAGKEVVLLDTQFGRDSCYGDSGGPVFMEEPGTRRLLLVAVVSRGAKRPATARGSKCGQGGIYTLMRRNVIRWVVDTITRHERLTKEGHPSSFLPPLP